MSAPLLSPIHERAGFKELDRRLSQERAILLWAGVKSPQRFSKDMIPLIPRYGGVDESKSILQRASNVVANAELNDFVGPGDGVVAIGMEVSDIKAGSPEAEMIAETTALASNEAGAQWDGMAEEEQSVGEQGFLGQTASEFGGFFDELKGYVSDAGDYIGQADNIVKGTARWAFLTGDAWIDVAFDRHLRVAAGVVEGQSFSEANENAGEPALFGAITDPNTWDMLPWNEEVKGQTLLGEGWIPNDQGQLAPDVLQSQAAYEQEIANLTEENATGIMTMGNGQQYYTNNVADEKFLMETVGRRDNFDQAVANSSAQGAIGDPNVTASRLEREGVVTLASNPLWMNRENPLVSGPNDYAWSRVSLGRVFANLYTEPGTQPNDIASGAIDLWKQVAGDFGAVGTDVGALTKLIPGKTFMGRNTGRAMNVTQEAASEFNVGARNSVDELQAIAAQTRKIQNTRRLAANQKLGGVSTFKLQDTLDLKKMLADDFPTVLDDADLFSEGTALFDEVARMAAQGKVRGAADKINRAYMKIADQADEAAELGYKTVAGKNVENLAAMEELVELIPGIQRFDLDSTLKAKKIIEETAETTDEAMQLWDDFMEAFTSDPQEALLLAGRARPDVNSQAVNEFFTGPQAAPFIDQFVGKALTMRQVDALLTKTGRAGTLPNHVRTLLAGRKLSQAEVIDIFLPLVDSIKMDSGLYATARLPTALNRVNQAQLVTGTFGGGAVAAWAAADDAFSKEDMSNADKFAASLEVLTAGIGGSIMGGAIATGGTAALTGGARIFGVGRGTVPPATITDAMLSGARGAVEDAYMRWGTTNPAVAMGRAVKGKDFTTLDPIMRNNGVLAQRRYMNGTNGMLRRFSEMAPDSLDLNNMKRGYLNVKSYLRNMGMDGDERVMIFTRKSADGGMDTRKVSGKVEFDEFDAYKWADDAHTAEQVKLEGTGWKLSKDVNLDSALRELSTIQDFNFTPAFAVIRNVMDNVFLKLVDEGVADETARAVTRFTVDLGEDAMYNVNAMGDTVTYPGNSLKAILGDSTVDMPGPQVLAELFGGQVSMPPPRFVKQVAAQLDGIGRVANAVAIKNYRLRDTPLVMARELSNAVPGLKNFDPADYKATGNFNERVLTRTADWTMQKVWKPVVLLRGAFPVRIIALDEQARMASAGLDSMYRNPVSYMAYLIGNGKLDIEDARLLKKSKAVTLKGKGKLSEVDLTKINWNDVDEVAAFDDLVSSMSSVEWAEAARDAFGRQGGFAGEYGTLGSQYWTKIQRGSSGYRDAMASELRQMFRDPLVKSMFDPGGDFRGIDETVEWLTKTSGGDGVLTTIARQLDITPDELRGHPLELRAYVDGVYARAQLKAGGDWNYTDSQGLIYNSGGEYIGKAQGGFQSGYEITRAGDGNILKAYGTGKWGELNVGSRITDDMYDSLKQLVSETNTQMGRFPDGPQFPQFVKGARNGNRVDGLDSKEFFDRALRGSFDLAMQIPTNKLSRSPAFRQLWYNQMADVAHNMDDATYSRFLRVAKADGMEKKVLARMTMDQSKGNNTLRNFGELDGYAKSYALTGVQDLLFDLSKKQNVSDSIRIFAPFAEAFREVFVSWGQIFKNNPYKIPRRTQQLITGGRENDPFEQWDQNGKGFFYENEHGQEVFNYPLVGLATSGLNGIRNLPVVEQVADFAGMPEEIPKLEMTGSVGGMNMVFGGGDLDAPDQPTILGMPLTIFIPGIGPVVQWVAGAFMGDDPAWDGIKAIVAPFGPATLKTTFMPPWARSLLRATSPESTPEDQRMYDNTMGDAYNAMMVGGRAGYGSEFEFDLSDPDGQIAAREEAFGQAKFTYTFQAIGKWALPSSPQQPSFLVDLPSSVSDMEATEMWTLERLGNAYGNIFYGIDSSGERVEEGSPEEQEWLRRFSMPGPNGELLDPRFDHTLATRVFQQLYGGANFSPAALLISGSEAIEKRGFSEGTYDWERSNKKAFELMPQTAYYLPTNLEELEAGPFSYSAYVKQIRDGTRVPRTIEERMLENDYVFGQMALDNARSEAVLAFGDSPEGAARKAHDLWLTQKELQIKDTFPGWSKVKNGQSYQPDYEKAILGFEDWHKIDWEELTNDQGQLNTASAVVAYMDERDSVLRTYQETVGSKTFSGKGGEDSYEREQAAYMQNYMSEYATFIMGDTYDSGNFELIWDKVLSKEFDLLEEDEVEMTEGMVWNDILVDTYKAGVSEFGGLTPWQEG